MGCGQIEFFTAWQRDWRSLEDAGAVSTNRVWLVIPASWRFAPPRSGDEV
jgi:hypothetical protein